MKFQGAGKMLDILGIFHPCSSNPFVLSYCNVHITKGLLSSWQFVIMHFVFPLHDKDVVTNLGRWGRRPWRLWIEFLTRLTWILSQTEIEVPPCGTGVWCKRIGNSKRWENMVNNFDKINNDWLNTRVVASCCLFAVLVCVSWYHMYMLGAQIVILM